MFPDAATCLTLSWVFPREGTCKICKQTSPFSSLRKTLKHDPSQVSLFNLSGWQLTCVITGGYYSFTDQVTEYKMVKKFKNKECRVQSRVFIEGNLYYTYSL